MTNRKFYDEISDEIITFEQVKDLYREAKQDGLLDPDEIDSFNTWFARVQSYNNGTLTEVYDYSMTVYDEETDRYVDIVSSGSTADDAAKRWAVANDKELYPVVISSRVIR